MNLIAAAWEGVVWFLAAQDGENGVVCDELSINTGKCVTVYVANSLLSSILLHEVG
jgi:hypothetical protein